MTDANAFFPPTAEEQEVIDRLRERYAKEVENPMDAIHNNSTVMRFYRGMKRKEEHAFNDLVRYHKWREEHGVDTVDTVHEDRIKKVLGLNLCVLFYDKVRRPSSYVFVRKHKPSERNIEDFHAFIIHSMERLLKEADPVEQRGIIVMDLKGFGLGNMDYELVKLLLAIVQSNYPETMHRILVVDSPYIFSACWAVIRPWIDPVTAAKIEFISRDKLTDFFHEHDIPKDE